MKFNTQQFDALHRLAMEAQSRGKQVQGIGWTSLRDAVTLWVDKLTAIRFNGEGFDIYRAKALAEMNITAEQAHNVIMAAAVHSTLVHKPVPPVRSENGSKSGLIIAMVLRPEGATTAEIKNAVDWPTINVRHHARKCGLLLTTSVDVVTGLTRYFAKRPLSLEIVDDEPADNFVSP